jgi:putative SOS response-associated peptidase YedK
LEDPDTGEWERTFAIITVPSNELVSHIHDRMPAVLRRSDYDRWLGREPDPRDLLITYPPEGYDHVGDLHAREQATDDDPSLLNRVEEPADWQAPLDRK